MECKKLKFALFGNCYQENKVQAVRRVVDSLVAHQAEVSISYSFNEFVRTTLQMDIPYSELIESDTFTADYVVCMGGDGTFLDVASRVGNKEIPIIGVNTGRLGFLAGVSPDEIDKVLDAVYEGRFTVEGHSVLRLMCDDVNLMDYPCALNEIAILKHDISSMISIRTCIDGEYLTTYQADGLIVGTPTGSTAYSLSVGGPIVVPQSRTITLTPIAPHSLNMRPIVLTDDSSIELEVKSRSNNFLIAIDGRSHSYPDSIKLRIRKAPYEVKVVSLLDQNFFSTLSRKMMWGVDKRD